jgi:hypothetical protein
VNRKLLLLNVVLVLVVAYAGYLLRNEFRAAKARETAMKNAPVKATPPAPLPPLANQPPVLATGYQDIATKNLFHPSRDSKIPVEVPPPPPPPPPMPPLPRYHGTMNIGEGPMALLALGNGPSQEVKAGEMIGPFKLVEVNTVDITFEWQGQIARRTLDQITDRTTVSSGSSGDVRSVASTPASVAAPVVSQPLGPGDSTAFGFKTCQANDNMPVGTVQGGFRKVSVPTPFGNACRWDPVTGR